ncbi:chemotaxis-specific protein-glutamate methyltransferase CheB [Polyangium mundeleinium]|uniref:Protein-glutamate methylesterase/protein-glutamine glutaminase n=1 Tax=Polyangium mundeleinium TaxID=2995306 RepID=A0ABT5EIP6_9BACT|nr:chemotaxis-specific protein-glutamate methyltransferase CheB [Polyangium mundeleinium]MDC0741636.1 chemotaxis-specific protein-glutamate methyltransferase CheB [Polyangium mundeleinium]
MERPIRVLVVDDSAFARKVLREVLSKQPGLEVVDIARDGLDALEKIAEHRPDVVVLDLVMPNLDGIGVLRALPTTGAPAVVAVSISDAQSELGQKALAYGAVDLVQKPTSLATDRLYEVSNELVVRVLAAAALRRGAEHPRETPAARPIHRTSLVVVGASTGGPQALTRLFTSLPRDFPVPVVAALHIPPGYTAALARRINEASAVSVQEALDDQELAPGLVVLARGGTNLRVERRAERPYARLETGYVGGLHRPSVDLLFRSAAEGFGAGVLGVVLTGMGDDGLEGARAIHAAGGRLLVEAESSCVVYGMPRCVREAGLALGEAPIDKMGDLLVWHAA